MSAPVRAEKPNFRTTWLEGSGGILDPYWQRIFTRQIDIINAQAAQIEALAVKVAALEQFINAQAAQIEALAVKVAALEQYNIDHP